MSRETQIVGLDVGTAGVRAVAVVLGSTSDSSKPRVIGKAQVRSKGVRKGQIIHIEDVVSSVDSVMRELERSAGIEPRNIIVGVTGSHIQSFSSHGVVPVKSSEVRRQDINSVVEAAQAVPISADREVLHVIPQEFIVDGQTGIKDPLGISGVRLEASVQLLTAASFGAQNIMKCVNKCGYSVAEIVFTPLATAHKLMLEEELEQGTCLIDIGAGTTEISVFYQGALAFAHVLGIGGQHVTNDLAAGLKTSIRDAEALKLQLDITSATPQKNYSVLEIGREEQKTVAGIELVRIAEPRVEETLMLVKRALAEHITNPKMLSAGVVLTGGGALLKGVEQVAERVLEVPCRTRFQIPGIDKEQISREFITAYGLAGFQKNANLIFGNRAHQSSVNWYRRIASWFVEHF